MSQELFGKALKCKNMIQEKRRKLLFISLIANEDKYTGWQTSHTNPLLVFLPENNLC